MQYTTDFYPKIRLSPSSSNAVRYYGKQVRSRYLNESPRQKTYKYWIKGIDEIYVDSVGHGKFGQLHSLGK